MLRKKKKMTFVDTLRQPNDTELNKYKEITYKYLVNIIIQTIHKDAKNAAEQMKNNIHGYIGRFGLVSAELKNLGYNLHYDDDPVDFKFIHKSTNPKEGSFSHVFFEQNDIYNKVFPMVNKLLSEDGFNNIALRCDKVDQYNYERKHGLLFDRSIKVYTGKYELYLYVDVSW